MVKDLESSDKNGDFWETKINTAFNNAGLIDPGFAASASVAAPRSSYIMFGKVVKSYSDIQYILVSEYATLFDARDQVIGHLKEIGVKEQDDRERDAMVKRVADCHLRAELLGQRAHQSNRMSSCELCKSDRDFKAYASLLFSSNDEVLKRAPEAPGSDVGYFLSSFFSIY